MCAFLRYSAGGLAALVTTAYVAVSAENGLSAFRPTVIETSGAGQTVVNRMNKGDRERALRDVSAPTSAQRKPAAAKERKILEGCDPAFSPLMESAKTNFAGRCVT
jgi:hypothetical protein